MENLTINYFAVFVGAVLSMVIGAIWYGPVFGKKWIEIIGVDANNEEERKKMQKSAGPMYFIQFALTLFQVYILARFVSANDMASALEKAVWIWAAFVIPTLAGAVMWTNQSGKLKWERFFIQGGYQLIIFIVFGLLLYFWK
jgi:hypothetical protein